jgi:hypothetical protein
LAKLFQRRRFFRNRPTGQELPMVAVFVNGWRLNEQFLIDASYQVSVHLAKRFQRRNIFRNRPTRNKNCMWRPYLLMDQDKMNKLYNRPSIDASYQVSVHSAKQFQRGKLYNEPLIDAFYQVSVHLAKRFQRTIFLEIYQSETRIAFGGNVC